MTTSSRQRSDPWTTTTDTKAPDLTTTVVSGPTFFVGVVVHATAVALPTAVRRRSEEDHGP
ncbi:hypothetical protein AB4091_21645 [Terrabacter sp. 2RAF25]